MALVCLLQKKLHRLELVKKNTKLQKNVSGVFATKQHLQLNVLKSHGNGEEKHYELYNCDVVVPELQGIILLELESNGIKTTIENKQKVRHPNHPFCRIIIDNRQDHQIIAIEKTLLFRRYRQGCTCIAEWAESETFRLWTRDCHSAA